MRPCIFRILFQMNEISCISIRRVLSRSGKVCQKMRKHTEAAGTSEVRTGESTDWVVEKSVDNVHNFLHKRLIFRRRGMKEGRSSELFHTGPFFTIRNQGTSLHFRAFNAPGASESRSGPGLLRRRAWPARPGVPWDGAGDGYIPRRCFRRPGPASMWGAAG